MRTLILSDLRIGPAGPFGHSAGALELPRLLAHYAGAPTRIVFNGSAFEFRPALGESSLPVDRAVARLQEILDAPVNQAVFQALRALLDTGGHVVLCLGGHERELGLIEVRRVLRSALGCAPNDAHSLEIHEDDSPFVLKLEAIRLLLLRGRPRPDPAELAEARRLQARYEASAALIGHTPTARWRAFDEAPDAGAEDWRFSQNPPSDEARLEGGLLYSSVEPSRLGVRLALRAWLPGAEPAELGFTELRAASPRALVPISVSATPAPAAARVTNLRTACPIILAHGIARFDALWKRDNDEKSDGFHYWRNVRGLLMENGYTVHHTDVDWAGSVERRAAQLTGKILEFLDGYPPGQKVNIIAHSMGGLDSRVAIAEHGLAPRVASLTTIGTPHHGSPFADWGFETGLAPLVKRLMSLIGIDAHGLESLTTVACAARNARLKSFEEANVHGIRYHAYAGAQDEDRIFGPLVAPFRIIHKREGANDGLVSVRSALWGNRYYKGTLNADHLNEIGWWDLEELGFLFRGRTPAQFREYIDHFYLKLAAGLP